MKYNQSGLRIDQILPSLGCYDAIGSDVLTMREMIREKGIESDIFVEQGIHKNYSRHYSEYNKYNSHKNILIHHFSIGSILPSYLLNTKSRKLTRYHNITPEKFFNFGNMFESKWRCAQGRMQMSVMQKITDYYLAVSNYNAQELNQHHMNTGRVLPILKNYQEITESNNCDETLKKLEKDSRKTILFVGRVIPNKAHHDLIFFLKMYQKYFSKNIKLICVGYLDAFYLKNFLMKILNDYKISYSLGNHKNFKKDVIFTGPVNLSQMATYYRQADAFVCMSDHEGFCVPLVEAMNFGLPIVANNRAAIPETLGEGGLVVDKNRPEETLQSLYNVLNDTQMTKKYAHLSKERAKDFSLDKIKMEFNEVLDELV